MEGIVATATILSEDMMLLAGKTSTNRPFAFTVRQGSIEPACKLCCTLIDIFRLLRKGEGFACQWSRDGHLEVIVSREEWERAKESTLWKLRESKFHFNIFSVTEYSGYFSNSLPAPFKGFLIEKNMILTLGEALFDRTGKRTVVSLTFNIPTNHFTADALKFLYPEELRMCTEEEAVLRCNYGVAFTTHPIHLNYYPTLIENYSERAIARRIRQLGIEASFHYEVGQHFILRGDLDIRDGLVRLPMEVEKGLPIMVRFSSARLGCIGMTTHSRMGVLFTQEVTTNILRWMEESSSFEESQLFHNYELRIVAPELFPIDRPELPTYRATVVKFTNKANLMGGREEDFEEDIRNSLISNSYIEAALTSEEMAFRFKHLPKQITCVRRTVGILDHVLGEDNVKKSILWFDLGVFYMREEMKEEAQQCFELACAAE